MPRRYAETTIVPYRAPKRRIEKQYGIVQHAITDSNLTVQLAHCEDKKTLVRTIIDIQLNQRIAGKTVHALLLSIRPQGVTVEQPSYIQAGSQKSGRNRLWEHVGVMEIVGTNTHLHYDIKGQRKLNVDDDIYITSIADQATSVDMHGVVTMFFKE